MEVSEIFDSVLDDVVAESFHRCGEWGPVEFEIHKLAPVDWNDPVIREVLVTDFTHLRFLLQQNIRAKRQHREDNTCLLTKGNRSMWWLVTIDWDHIVDIIVLHRINELLDQLTIQLEPLEVSAGILLRNKLWTCILIVGVARLLAQGHHKVCVLTCWAGHVPNVAGDDSFTRDRGDQLI